MKNNQTVVCFIIQEIGAFSQTTQLPRGAESIFFQGLRYVFFSFQSEYS